MWNSRACAEKDCAVVYANPEKEIEKAYGPWMRAQTRNSQVNTGARWLRNSTMTATEQGSNENFRATGTCDADITENFIEIGGRISEKGGTESGITIKFVPAVDKAEGSQIQKETDMIVVDKKRRRVEEDMGFYTGPSPMSTDGLEKNNG